MYTIKNCSVNVGPGILCSETFDLFKHERNVSLPPVKPDLFTNKVKTIRAGPEGLTDGVPANTTTRSKDVIQVNVRDRGVYFALFDRSACQALFSFEVSYRVCRKAVVNLVSFERGNTANGNCVANAKLSPNAKSVPRAVCDINGEWNIDSNVSCVCRAGYRISPNGEKCFGNHSFFWLFNVIWNAGIYIFYLAMYLHLHLYGKQKKRRGGGGERGSN